MGLSKGIAISPGVKLGRNCLIDAWSFGRGQISIGKRTEIQDYCRLQTYGGSITIGDDCSLNPFCIVYGHGGLRIGNAVRIATGCVIIPANHTFSDPSRPIMMQPESRKGIVIEDDVWVGARCVILDGVTVGSGAVIAAASVVSKDVEPMTVVAGVPARLIKRR
jgi:acetyltransferase-like isoleucine patch superfamily enzyme